jgi:hypothetical protein
MNTTAKTNEQTLAMAFVIFLNWMISHLANSWVMPSEVESAVQSCLVIIIAWYVQQGQQRELRKQLDMAKALGWMPPSPSNDPAPAAPEPKAAA